MRKHPVRNILLDKLHRGFVIVCIGATLYGSAVIGIKWYRYVTKIKPELERQKLLEKQNLLAEGSSEILQT